MDSDSRSAAKTDAERVGAILKHTHPVAPAPHLKENALRLADHHRANCEGAICTISLVGLADLLQLAGYDLTDADIRRLI